MATGIPNIDNDELHERIASGDERAYTLFVNHYDRQIRPYVWQRTQSNVQTDEALQDTFLKIWVNREQLPAVKNMGSWIITIATRSLIDSMRRQLVRLQREAKMDSDKIAAAPTTPVNSADFIEMQQLVNEAIAAMPPARRKIYLMNRGEGKTPTKIAEELGLSVSTVKNTFGAALKDIRHCLLKGGYLFSLLFLM